MPFFTNLSFIFLLLGVCRTNRVTCEAIEHQSPTPSLEISHDFQAFDGMTQKISNLKVLWIGLE